MLDHRLRRWPHIEPTMAQCLVFAEHAASTGIPYSILCRRDSHVTSLSQSTMGRLADIDLDFTLRDIFNDRISAFWRAV